MSTTTYTSPQTHAGSVLTTISNDGTISVISIPPDSTIAVSVLRTAPAPSETYSGTDSAAAVAAIQALLPA